MTLVAVGLTAASVAVSVAGSVMSAKAAADGAENAQATLQGGVSRMQSFRQRLRDDNVAYKTWKEQVTGTLVTDALSQPFESQSYKDARMRLMASQAATGSTRSGAAQMGLEHLAASESERQFGRKMAVNQFLGQETGRNEALQAHSLDSEANLLGGKADAQQQEGNAKAAGIEGAAGAISSGLSAAGGAAGGMQKQGGPMPKMEELPDDFSKLNDKEFDLSKLSYGGLSGGGY